jgi:hypothetical protein
VAFRSQPGHHTPTLVVGESKSRGPELLGENPILILEAVNDLALLPAELPTTEISRNETDDESADRATIPTERTVVARHPAQSQKALPFLDTPGYGRPSGVGATESFRGLNGP